MTRSKLILVLALVATLTAPGHTANADSLPLVRLGCDTIWGDGPGEGSFRLGNNLRCSTSFLQIVRDGITVDLDGHRVTGPGNVSGLSIFGRKNVTVKNGVIDNFDFAVIAGGNLGLRLENLTIKSGNPSNPGIEIQGGALPGGVQSGDISVVNNTIVDARSINLSNLARDVTVSGNTLVRSRISIASVDGNTVTGNRILGGIGPGISITDGSEENTVSNNEVIGTAGSGIDVSGNDADDNIVRANTVRANLAGAGISVDEADRTQILDNTVTGNENGVVVSGFADDTRISGNTLSANHTVGITTQGSGTRIVGNKLNENGGAGIQAGGNNTKIKDNQLNFNGYDQGLNNNSILGAISGVGIIGSGNTAKGNDVSGSTQCSPDICEDGSTAPPTLTTCGQNVTDDRKLRNPLHCETSPNSAFGLRVSGSGFTVRLGRHIVTGGNVPGEAAVIVNNSAASIELVGGVLGNAESGIFTPSLNPAKQITISDSTIVANDSFGILLQGEDPTPDDETITAGRHVVEDVTIVGSGVAGVFVADAPRNTLQRNVVTGGSAVGVDLSQSAGNLLESNKLIGNSTGLDMSNDGAATELPVKETIRANTIVGSSGPGIRAFNAVEIKILENKIRGSGDSAQAGILLDGDAGGPGGSLDNVVGSNVVTGSAGNGLTLAADSSENRIKNNVLGANDDNGMEVREDADDNVISANQMNENGNDGLVVDDPVAISELSDVVTDNVANGNGFLATATGENTGNDQGFGMDVATDTDGSGNTAKKNDNPLQCSPNPFC